MRLVLLVTVVSLCSLSASASTRFPIAYDLKLIETEAGPSGVVSPADMNSHGQVVGSHRATNGHVATPFVWSEQDGLRSLEPVEAEHPGGRALAINENGTIVGYVGVSQAYAGILVVDRRAVVWSPDGGVTDLVQVDPEANFFLASVINDDGEIFGEAYYRSSEPPYGHEKRFVRYNQLDGLVPVASLAEPPEVDLAELQPSDFDSDPCDFGPGANACYFWPRKINDNGFLLGSAQPNTPGPGTVDQRPDTDNAIVWDYRNDEAILLENRLTPKWAGWRVDVAIDMNPDGTILAAGQDAGFNRRSFLLIPIPEPTAVGVLGIGLCTLTSRGSRPRPQLSS